MMQVGFYFDQTRCPGCYTCVVACKDWHDVPEGPASWRRLVTIEEGEFPDLFVAFLTTSCYHCAQPACAAACPVEALSEDGINKMQCMGNCIEHLLMPPRWVLSMLRWPVAKSRLLTNFMDLFAILGRFSDGLKEPS